LKDAHPVLTPEEAGGAVVQHVEPGSVADVSGLQAGDVILEANKQRVANAAGLEALLDEAKAGQIFLFYVFRAGNYLFVAMDL
jgi:serine protease Do